MYPIEKKSSRFLNLIYYEHGWFCLFAWFSSRWHLLLCLLQPCVTKQQKRTTYNDAIESSLFAPKQLMDLMIPLFFQVRSYKFIPDWLRDI